MNSGNVPVCHKAKDGLVMFWCPGCEHYHGVSTELPNELTGAKWQWNGSLVRPTFKPSILVRGTRKITDEEYDRIMAGEKLDIPDTVCHSFVTGGKIRFLSDCTHALAGQTVDMEPDE